MMVRVKESRTANEMKVCSLPHELTKALLPKSATSRPLALAWIVQIVDSPVRVRIPRGLRPIVLQELVTNRSTATLSSTPAHGIASMLVRDVRSCLAGGYSRAATLSWVMVSKSLAS